MSAARLGITVVTAINGISPGLLSCDRLTTLGTRTLPAGDVFRARLILALAEGQSYREMVRGMRTSAATIARWRRRFEQDRLAGLEGRHRGSKPRTATPAVQARVVRRVQTPISGFGT